MPAKRKVIKDIVMTPIRKYEEFYSDLSKKEEAQNQAGFANKANIRSAEEHERRKRGDLSGSPTLGKALMSLMDKKSRGTDSSATRKLIK